MLLAKSSVITPKAEKIAFIKAYEDMGLRFVIIWQPSTRWVHFLQGSVELNKLEEL